MNPARKRWTPDEDEYLATMYGTGLLDMISERLGRSEKAIQQRAHRLSIPGMRSQGRRLVPDHAALTAFDGACVNEADVLGRLRVAAGISMKALSMRSGYRLNDKRLLGNPTLRKAIDIANSLGFELVLRRRA